MENNHPIHDLMATTIEKLRDMVEANTIVGTPITTPDGIMLIPVSRLSMGFGAGGGDFDGKAAAAPANHFGGGGGAGVKVDPVAFLIVKEGSVRLLSVGPYGNTTLDRVIDMVPDVIDKVEGMVDKKRAAAADKDTF